MKEKEDEASKWLRENDWYFTDKSRVKNRKIEYPYLTESMYDERNKKEKAFSQLSKGEAIEAKSKNVDAEYLDFLKDDE
ncbi:hypothetical protein [Dethiobacter alkaliphilus]|uniref:Uncharacterized protein n=1 Tax=Dethiobacter alkaliphilus AHT 1 TaxID=555088 RepID=C0GET4_DETAL|nr:hypothetical protein [Dethiobacter alkaliphilus]EEG78116.1 hypothetical protein DealDRAFT_0993 [Dethiobacter alkaliphilus AHT 1]